MPHVRQLPNMGHVFLCMLALGLGVEEDAGQDGHGANGLEESDAFAEKKEAKNGGENGFAQLGGGDVGGGEPLQAPGEEGMAQQGTEHSQQQSHAHLPEAPAQHRSAGGGVQHQQDDEAGEVGEEGVDGGGLPGPLDLKSEAKRS